MPEATVTEKVRMLPRHATCQHFHLFNMIMSVGKKWAEEPPLFSGDFFILGCYYYRQVFV